jgi:paraquat-inducible protein B
MEIHEPKKSRKSKLSLLTSIWIVPVIALLISLWFAYQYFAQLGPEIQILFKENSGLQANQSYVKYRDVPVGVVKEITLDKKSDNVVVTIRMNKEAEPFLNDETKFWIVKPEVGSGGISGLDTLISGTYIKMYAKKKDGEEVKKIYEGLEKPYIDRNCDTGYRYHLSAPDSRNLHIGSPVYYRKIRVGEIEDIYLAEDGMKVNFDVFIKHPYTNYISKETKFWLMSNISFTFNHSGFNLDMAPMSHILNGDITFDTPARIIHEKQQGISHIFFLYKDKLAMQKKRIGLGKAHQHHYFMLVDEPIAKLDVGAPVEFFGFQVGSVVAMHSDFDNTVKKIISTVEVVIDTSAFADRSDKNTKNTEKFFENAVQKGLRARISQSDPITGSQYVELVYEGKEGQRTIERLGNKQILPTIRSKDVDIAQKLSLILDKVNELDIEGLLASVQKAVDDNSAQSVKILKEFAVIAKNFRVISSDPALKKTPKKIIAILNETHQTLEAINGLLQANGNKSALSKEITITLHELTDAARSLERLSNKLEKNPNALIFGDK